MNASTAIEKRKIDLEGKKLYLDAVKTVATDTSRVVEKVVTNPFVMLVLANVLIEYLQTIQIKTGYKVYSEVSQEGTHAKYWDWVDQTKPLISQAHATTMESIINTTGALSGLGINIGDLLKLIK